MFRAAVSFPRDHRRHAATLIVALAVCGGSMPARADPCTGAPALAGARFAGAVRYVGDGDSLCTGPEGRPDRWIEIRLGDFYAPGLSAPGGDQAQRRLAGLTFGKLLSCRAGWRS
jgi:hypothetical protein